MKVSSLKRVLQSIEFQKPDHVPVVPIIGAWSTRLAGISVKEGLTDPDKQTRTQLLALEKYGYDGVFTYMDLSVEAEGLGLKTKMTEDSIPYVMEHFVGKEEDLQKLKIPKIEQTRMNVFIESTRKLRNAVGDDIMVSAYTIGPFTLAGHLMGINNLLKGVIVNKNLVHKVLEFCSDFIKEYAKALTDAGAHAITVLEPSASSNLISPKHFGEYVFWHLKEINHFIAKRAIPVLHICGNTNPIIEKMAETEAKVLSVDSDVDMRRASGLVKNKAVLMGNIAPVKLLLQGNIDQVREASLECVRETGGGLILSSGCEIPIGTPSENIREMVKVSREINSSFFTKPVDRKPIPQL